MLKKGLFIIFVPLLLLTACTSQSKNHTVELTISAASSMKDVLTKIQRNYEKANPEIKLYFNFGASGALQQQISQGAEVDVFLSAAKKEFNQLEKDGILDFDYSSNLVGNKLVLVQPKNSSKANLDFKDLVNGSVEKISIGTPESVPAGMYAQELLNRLGIWSKVNSKIIFTKDVRQVLTYVETGNVDAGIVYRTDALVSKKVIVTSTAAPGMHQPIIYPVGVLKESKQKKEAIAFYEYLKSKEAQAIFEEFGFQVF
ncbi:molybdate ABC transporter substrate-binding protein [Bacillus massilinigeriensis]|uniref:molybdate ABC transporter substrate-binding protein n=1 Tax=Bacillus massilionigeriensis TaxID=1805475 RepID=UPI00096B3534|nr:molybdate ABC transporter substrate-binding protein [Bacillus massilionigeriensis]